MDIGVLAFGVTMNVLLVLVGALILDSHPDDRRRAGPWLLGIGSAVVVIGLLIVVRAIQVGV